MGIIMLLGLLIWGKTSDFAYMHKKSPIMDLNMELKEGKIDMTEYLCRRWPEVADRIRKEAKERENNKIQ